MKENDKVKSESHAFVILWGLLMHIVLLWGVMDANFHSPIISGLPVIPAPKDTPPAKRVMIFLADGLRYRTFRDNLPPYLTSVIQKKGVWGISHTRMPTESRPGNIAVVAGLYEDPSAVFRGWKESPVDFDSVFNQSRTSWIWGSPDIIPLFTKNGKNNIHGKSYPHDWQDFRDDYDSIKRLDDWVFKQYWQWLENEAHAYKTEDKHIFYFHLLGCDTSGHAFKPQSKVYVDIMKEVDHNIHKVVQETEKFFDDASTAYIFTSDHGMTDWGSHGSGSVDETETPFVAWGAGIQHNTKFYDIEQADITPFISSLIGIPVPINNEGVLPYELLDPKNEKYIIETFLNNAKQLAEQVQANRELMIGNSIVNMYYKDKEFSEKIVRVEQQLQEGGSYEDINEIKNLTGLAKESLTYYRRYLTQRFMICLALMWIGWIVLLFVDLTGTTRRTFRSGNYVWLLFSNIALAVMIIILVTEYAGAGCKEWRLLGYGIICAFSIWLALRSIIKKRPELAINSKKPLYELFGIIILSIMMIVGLTHRWVFSVSMLLAVGLQKFIFERNASLALVITGVVLSIFPVLPVVEPHPRIYVVLFALMATLLPIKDDRKIYKFNKTIETFRIILTSLICWNVLDGKFLLSWLLLLSTPIVIWLYPKEWNQRSFGITVALLSPLALLSASYEPIFYLIFSSHLRHWPIYEFTQKEVSKAKTKVLSLRNFTTAVFLVLYTLLSFFGTGNMASISSFDPLWTRHFLTVFSPFTMAILIVFKIAIPLILVGCLMHALAPDLTMFSTVLLLGDCLAIPLMFGLTNQGSWLDIGSAISRFVIAIALPCLLLLLHFLTQPLTTFSLQEFMQRRKFKSQRLKI